MTNKPRNPQAYPGGLQPGMTLRDAFAMAAMQGYCSDISGTERLGYDNGPEQMAIDAYAIADAMLRAREIEK